MDEIWKDIPGFEGAYEVSNLGRVRNVKRGNLLKPYKQPTGHMYIKSIGGRNGKFAFLHRLVYEVFIGPIPENAVVRHIDGDASNNSLDNHAVGSQKENIHDIYTYGKKCGPGKLYANDVLEIRRKLAEGCSVRKLATEYGVSDTAIYLIKSNKTFYYM